jgi:hypothetical protein
MVVTSFNSPTSWNVTRGYNGTGPYTGYVTLYADITLDTIPAGWEIRHEFDNCFIPCAGNTYAVNNTGGNNHWELPIHTHGIGSVVTISGDVRSWHYHPLTANLLSASTGAVLQYDGSNNYPPDIDNWMHIHTSSMSTYGYGKSVEEHTHVIPDTISNSFPEPGETNFTVPSYVYGVYFIQKVV